MTIIKNITTKNPTPLPRWQQGQFHTFIPRRPLHL